MTAITNYIEECLFEPGVNWPEYWFSNRVYSRWAAYEILELIADNRLTPPDITVKEFIIKMKIYSYMAEGTKSEFIFSIAKAIAEDILLLLEGENDD